MHDGWSWDLVEIHAVSDVRMGGSTNSSRPLGMLGEEGRIQRKQRLGGMFDYYYRLAA